MFDLEDNDQFSKLSAKDKKSLLKFLKNYYIEYKSYLGLDERMTFGIEIECFIPKQTRKTNEHSGHTSFSLHKECTVNNKFGWEFQSPILQDNPSSWSEIKDTCEYLKSFCKINERCGGHIHLFYALKALFPQARLPPWKHCLWRASEAVRSARQCFCRGCCTKS